MDIRHWLVHPDRLIANGRPISNAEQRMYLYEQQKQLEKAIRYQEWISESIGSLVNSRSHQVNSIVSYQQDSKVDYTGFLQEISWWIDGVWNKMEYGMNILSQWLKQINITQLLELDQIRNLAANMQASFSATLQSMEEHTAILIKISSRLWEILKTLQNPRKIEGLEYKRDAIGYLQKKWHKEAFDYFGLAAEKLTSDQDVYYMMGLIEFEENKNYQNAIVAFEKAIKYAKWYGDINIHSQSADKLGSIYFILNGNDSKENTEKLKKAYSYQLDAVEVSNWSPKYIFDLLKYSILLWEYKTFEKYLYPLLRADIYSIATITMYSIFVANPKVVEIINKTIEIIRQEDKRTNQETTRIQKEKEETERNYQEHQKCLNEFHNKFDFLNKEILATERIEVNKTCFIGEECTGIHKNGLWILKTKDWKFLINSIGNKFWPFDWITLTDKYAIVQKKWWYNAVMDYNWNIIINDYCYFGWWSYLVWSRDETRLLLEDWTYLYPFTTKYWIEWSRISFFDYKRWYALVSKEIQDQVWRNRIYGSNDIYKIYKNWRTELIKNYPNKTSSSCDTSDPAFWSFWYEFEVRIRLWLDEDKYSIKHIEHKWNGEDIYILYSIKGLHLITGNLKKIEEYLKEHGEYIDKNPEIFKPIQFWKGDKIGWNFCKPDWTLLIRSSNYPKLQEKHNELDAFIQKYVPQGFDQNDHGTLNINGVLSPIVRKKTKFWIYKYKFTSSW